TVRAEAGDEDVVIRLKPTGVLEVRVTEPGDPDPVPMPARIQVIPKELPVVPRTYGERDVPTGRLHVLYSTTGDETIRVPVGEHRVVVSRGFEYEIYDSEAVADNPLVGAEDTVTREVFLSRVVDTT